MIPEVNRFLSAARIPFVEDRGVRLFLKPFAISLSCVCAAAAMGQSGPASATPPPVTFTSDQDHQNMMDQLGIKALRPGPSGNENAPNHANYDEAKANPYPDLPDPLTLNDGQKVSYEVVMERGKSAATNLKLA